jgi:hypothetical protein
MMINMNVLIKKAFVKKCRFQGPDGGIRGSLLRVQEQRAVHKLLLRALPVRDALHLEQSTRWLPCPAKQGTVLKLANNTIICIS